MSITAMKAALEALEQCEAFMDLPVQKRYSQPYTQTHDAITALRAAIAEQEQCEPVGYARYEKDKLVLMVRNTVSMDMFPIYTNPAPTDQKSALAPRRLRGITPS